ncbi:AraC family transcriptional regulator [[Clostridium] symbiosum]|uniref:AraC family transcriptional regulator n=1 Tax=Clostridium symbiosum TaxID=1512 RepID=UPI001D062E54|nr:AraC family transcriptional regulator [[Clostridium] symbiosum]MCB6610784.1 AraC family transcriptional regulator [[Clostridium] symbiosum]MCB6930951.1 AraC family transcriptional regulator [[Clostridium] symbiosum]
MQEQIEAVQRMQDYIGEHLTENITLAELSRVSLFSPWYSYRLFTQQVGITPADYIRRMRLSRSALKLRDDSCRIADVAFEMGFGSVDGYQRAFLREFGCNPREYALNPVPLYLFTPYGVKFRNIERRTDMENLKNVFIQVIEKPARKVIIKRGVKANDYFAYCEEVGCDVWGLLQSIKSISGEPVCMWLPHRFIKPGTSEYVQGVEVSYDYDGIVPEGFEVLDLPAAKYMMFQGEPFAEEDYCVAIDEVKEAIRRYNLSMTGYAWDEENPRIQLEPIGSRGYIEMLAVK